MSLKFDTRFEALHGQAVPLAGDILRVTANNPSAFTFEGTNSYIIGRDTLAVIDPGPLDEAHLTALMAAIDGRPVSHILVSHTHIDHSPLAARLQAETGAPIVAEGPHRAARPLHAGETNLLDASADTGFSPDIELADDALIDGDGWTIRAIHTPGHAANHLAFALEGRDIVFSADHVMAWSTSIVAPPDGSMSDYMASLDRLLERKDRLFLPGHGGPVRQPVQFMNGLKAHRRMRERAIIERLRAGDRTIGEIVKRTYRDIDPRLHGAASLSVLAQLEGLIEAGVVVCEDRFSINGTFSLV